MHISPHYLVASTPFFYHFQHSWVECSFNGSIFYFILFFLLVREEFATSEEKKILVAYIISLVADPKCVVRFKRAF